jgi:hypothetical protein
MISLVYLIIAFCLIYVIFSSKESSGISATSGRARGDDEEFERKEIEYMRLQRRKIVKR